MFHKQGRVNGYVTLIRFSLIAMWRAKEAEFDQREVLGNHRRQTERVRL
jgi:hypothetical protein